MAEDMVLDGADITESVSESGSDVVEAADQTAEEQDAVEVQATDSEDAASDGDVEGDEGAGDDDAAVEPVEYEDFTLPAGMEIDSEMMSEFKAEAQELGLSQEQAQMLVDRYVKGADIAAEKQVEAWKQVQDTWVDSVKQDDEIGGVDMEQKVAIANKALVEFGTKELVEALQLHGYGNHPEIVRFMYRVGKQMAPDEAKTASPVSSENIVDRWYGNAPKETN